VEEIAAIVADEMNCWAMRASNAERHPPQIRSVFGSAP